LLADKEDNKRLADLIEAQFPGCACERHSMGDGSPGFVADAELLHRLIVSPRDYDPQTGTIRATPFEKVFGNGLSVWRPIGDERDVEILLLEGLTRTANDPSKEVFAVCETPVLVVRGILDDAGNRVFCIYDQTVRRLVPAAPPVPTHANIFLRLPPPGTDDRRRLQKDYAGQLREKFLQRTTLAADYKNGLCVRLNARARNGEFTR
jgi:hypothetical protein